MLTRRAALIAAAALPLPAIAQSRPKVRFAGGGIALYGYMPFFVCGRAEPVCQARHRARSRHVPRRRAGHAGRARRQLGRGLRLLRAHHPDGGEGRAPDRFRAAGAEQRPRARRAQGEPNITSIAELKGKKVGVSAPGSATHLFVNQLVAKAGLKPTDFSAIGVGTTQTALTAFERGEVDALSLFDPIIADLELKGTINILADARDSKGTQAIFGGPYASGSPLRRGRLDPQERSRRPRLRRRRSRKRSPS